MHGLSNEIVQICVNKTSVRPKPYNYVTWKFNFHLAFSAVLYFLDGSKVFYYLAAYVDK